MDDDFLLAIQLQEQFNNEYETSLFSSNGFQDNIDDGFEKISKKRKVEVGDEGGYSDSDLVPYLKPSPRQERPLSIVDASWETLDPSPDVRSMFLEFNETFFWGKLFGVEVKWSPRMTLCAGVCSYEGRGGLCSIRLSEPLLKLRPRKDLVETLLHEMIHALLFVTQNNRDRDGHGPEFCKHMNRINDATGTKISIYHSFTDEVDVYRTHWWKCNGPCQTRKPYFGFVKRAMNRAPSSLDPWWEQHSRTCGGTYTKVKEPEGYGKKGKKEGKKEGKTLEKKAPANAKPSATTTASGLQDIRNMIPFSGKGFTLGGKSQSTTSTPSNTPFLPVIKSPPPSPKKLFPPSSPARNLGSPVLYGWDQNNKGMPNRTATSTGPKPPKKRSVGNTRAFVNINGSPVRIHKPRSSSQGNQDANNAKQRSIGDLFNRTDDLKKPLGQPSTTTSNTASKTNVTNSNSRTSVSSPSTYGSWDNSTAVSTGTKGSPANPTTLSKYFTPTNGDSKTLGAASGSGSGQGSRKRPWDERDKSSGAIFDIFQRTIANDKVEKSPTGQRTSATATITSLSSTAAVQPPTTAGLNATGIQDSFSTLSFSSSPSDLPVMVTCPACLTKVQESKINQHLDSCLNGF